MNKQPTQSQKYTEIRVSKCKQFPSDLAEISRGNEGWKPRSSLQLRSNPFETSNAHSSPGLVYHGEFARAERKSVSGETVDGVKERDDESGQPETMSYRRQAFAARLSRLVSFSVPSFSPVDVL